VAVEVEVAIYWKAVVGVGVAANSLSLQSRTLSEQRVGIGRSTAT